MSSPMLRRIALVGRPNVGKSTLFNRLTRSRRAVVRNQPGVTRDIQIEATEWWGKAFEVADTGGLSPDKEGFSPLILEQVQSFLESVDAIIWVVDGREGLTAEDRLAFQVIRKSNRPFLLAVNKCDRTVEAESYLPEFFEFGVQPTPCAFEADFNIDKIVEWIIENLPRESAPDREGFRVTVIGKPNAGKSSLINRLLKQNRMLVSKIQGTTVDAIEAQWEWQGDLYILVDTAGIRRAGKQQDSVEVLSTFKTRDAVKRADMVLLVIDGVEGPSHQDSQLIDLCLEEHKALIVVASKMDLAKEKHEAPREWFRERVHREFHFFADVPVVFVSSETGAGINELMNKVKDIRAKLNFHISTSQLNRFFTEVIKQAPSPVFGTENVKFYYLTQTQQKPPSFIAFANHPEGVTPSYRRFLVRKIQENWGLQGVPLRIFVMEKGG